MRFFIIIFCLLYSNLLFSQKFFIEVVVPNIPSINGEIQIGLYNKSATFPKVGKEFKTYRYKVTKKRMKFKLTGLPRGFYALALYHDINSDKVCNRNLIGIPTERFGFSNNVKPILSAPSFKSARLILLENKVVEIKLQ